MARLLQVNCLNCTYCCAALQLTWWEMLQSIEKGNKDIYKGLMGLTMVCVFCQQTEVFMPVELLQRKGESKHGKDHVSKYEGEE